MRELGNLFGEPFGGYLGLGHGPRLAGGGGFVYLLRDDFLTDEAAPLTSPRTAKPGPGTLTLVQTDGQFSISGGELVFPAQATPAWGDLSLYESIGRIRAAGLALLIKLNVSALGVINNGFFAGWKDAASGDAANILTPVIMFNTTNGLAITTTIVQWSLGAISVATDYRLVVALRPTGAFYFIKGGAFSNWTLVWVHATSSTATIYPVFSVYNNTGALDHFRVLDLPTPFSDDYGLATQRLAGARSAGDTLTHEANSLLEWTQTTIPSALQTEVRFRIQDATNYWQVTIDSTGALDLDEVVAGTPTQRATAAAVIANGDRIVVIADGTTIRVYEANTLRITYASATNFATATSGKLETEGTGGSVSDLISWPRTLTGSPAAILDQASA